MPGSLRVPEATLSPCGQTQCHVHTSELAYGRTRSDAMVLPSRPSEQQQAGMGPAVIRSCDLDLTCASQGIQGG